MKDWIHFITLLMATIIVLIMISSLYGCAFMVARETAKVIDIVTEEDKNPEKKKKIMDNKNKKKQSLKERAREFYCSKVNDPIKCEELK